MTGGAFDEVHITDNEGDQLTLRLVAVGNKVQVELKLTGAGKAATQTTVDLDQLRAALFVLGKKEEELNG